MPVTLGAAELSLRATARQSAAAARCDSERVLSDCYRSSALSTLKLSQSRHCRLPTQVLGRIHCSKPLVELSWGGRSAAAMVEPVLHRALIRAQVAALAALERATPRTGRGIWLPPRRTLPAGHELWFCATAVWIGAFALIIGLDSTSGYGVDVPRGLRRPAPPLVALYPG